MILSINSGLYLECVSVYTTVYEGSFSNMEGGDVHREWLDEFDCQLWETSFLWITVERFCAMHEAKRYYSRPALMAHMAARRVEFQNKAQRMRLFLHRMIEAGKSPDSSEAFIAECFAVVTGFANHYENIAWRYDHALFWMRCQRATLSSSS